MHGRPGGNSAGQWAKRRKWTRGGGREGEGEKTTVDSVFRPVAVVTRTLFSGGLTSSHDAQRRLTQSVEGVEGDDIDTTGERSWHDTRSRCQLARDVCIKQKQRTLKNSEV